MKRESLGWIVAGAVVVMFCTLGAMQQASRVGRFQIVIGVNPVGELAAEKYTMLLDTETGDTRPFYFDKVGMQWGLPVMTYEQMEKEGLAR